MSEPILRLRGVDVTIANESTTAQILSGVDLTVARGSVVGVVGESGSGKTMLMRSVMDLLPTGARVRADAAQFDGVDFALAPVTGAGAGRTPAGRGKRLPISMIFQDPLTALNPLRTVGYHLDEVGRRFHSWSRREAKSASIEHLDLVRIDDAARRYGQYPHELSGGMRQRVMIAMALLSEPELLIADEPTTALDVTIQAQVLDLLRTVQRERGLSIVFVTHDLGIVAGMCDEVVVMNRGVVVETGTADDIFYRPQQDYTRRLLAAVPGRDLGNREGEGTR